MSTSSRLDPENTTRPRVNAGARRFSPVGVARAVTRGNPRKPVACSSCTPDLTSDPCDAILNHMVYRSAQLDSTFFALADPTRREILSRLAAGDRSIGELASRFDMSLPAVSKHVRVLQRAGLASVEKQGRVRRAALNAAPMRHALEWIDHYRWFWESELDLRAKYLEA